MSKRIYASFVFSFIDSIMAMFPVGAVFYTLTKIQNNKAFAGNDWLVIFGILIISLVVRMVFKYLVYSFQSTAGFEFVSRERITLGDKLRNVGMGFFHERNMGDITTTVTTDLNFLENYSMVFQNVYLFKDTIENNIKFGCPEASHQQVVEAAKKARCHDFISLLPEGYNTMIGEGGSTLSGGEKQRISIARAMLKNAPIVLLDEATASVDPENEVYLQQAISTLVKDKTLIVIAHRLSTIRDAEQILVIDNGKLVQHGKHDELVLQEGIYQKYWNIRQNAKAWKVAQ